MKVMRIPFSANANEQHIPMFSNLRFWDLVSFYYYHIPIRMHNLILKNNFAHTRAPCTYTLADTLYVYIL